jgi:hypothetical protein
MSKLDARADRVRIIAHTLHGSVLDRDGHLMTVEIPADLLGAAMSMLSMGGFGMPDGVGSQSTRMAPRRITTMSGAMVIGQDEALTAYHRIAVDLRPRDAKIERGHRYNAADQARRLNRAPQCRGDLRLNCAEPHLESIQRRMHAVDRQMATRHCFPEINKRTVRLLRDGLDVAVDSLRGGRIQNRRRRAVLLDRREANKDNDRSPLRQGLEDGLIILRKRASGFFGFSAVGVVRAEREDDRSAPERSEPIHHGEISADIEATDPGVNRGMAADLRWKRRQRRDAISHEND